MRKYTYTKRFLLYAKKIGKKPGEINDNLGYIIWITQKISEWKKETGIEHLTMNDHIKIDEWLEVNL